MRIKPTNILNLPFTPQQNQLTTIPFPPYQRGQRYILISFFMDIISAILSLYIAQWLMPNITFSIESILLIALIWGEIFSLFVYKVVYEHRFKSEVNLAVRAILLSLLVLMGAFWLFSIQQPKIIIPLLFVINSGLALSWRLTFWLRRKANDENKPQRILLVGANKRSQQLAKLIGSSRWSHLHLCGYVDNNNQHHYGEHAVLGTFGNILEIVDRHTITEVIMVLPPTQEAQMNALIQQLQSTSVRIRVAPNYLNLSLYHTVIEQLGGLPLITLRNTALKSRQRLIKYVMGTLTTK